MLSLVPTPLANEVVSRSHAGEVQEKFPLDLVSCSECGHVQLAHLVNPVRLFRNYVYVSGTSPAFKKHFEQLADKVCDLASNEKNVRSVLEIGSNDGTLLAILQKKGYRVVGVDPAEEIAMEATLAGIPTLVDFFDRQVGRRLRQEHGPFDVVIANNVFAHSGDLSEILIGIEHVLVDDGIFVFEVSYLKDVIDKVLFDTIYHEHTSYHSLRPLVHALPKYGLEVFHAELIDTHGGSIRVYAQKVGGGRRVDPSVSALLVVEENRKLTSESVFKEFGQQIDRLGKDLKGILTIAHREGKRIAGFGAPAKTTTLCYQLGIMGERLEFIVDDNPRKQGKLTPGMHVPIVSRSYFDENMPELLVVFAWNFADSIIESNKNFLESGGTFVIPAPELRIVSK